jgi:steroid delta-isomerase-like uncharacterized protein
VDTRELIEATTTAWNCRDREGYLALYSEDCEVRTPGFTGRGREALAQVWEQQMTALPDNRVTVLRTSVGEGDSFAFEESVIEGTHTGPLQGGDGSVLPATGRHVSSAFCMVHEQRGGRLVASRLYFDPLELLAQLGVPENAAPA